jgi:hypothetical protein
LIDDYTHHYLYVWDDCLQFEFTVTQNPVNGQYFNGTGNHYVTLQTSDAAGNVGSCGFNVTTMDTLPPILGCPATLFVNVDEECTGYFNSALGQINVTENCGNWQIIGNHSAALQLSTFSMKFNVTDNSDNLVTFSEFSQKFNFFRRHVT